MRPTEQEPEPEDQVGKGSETANGAELETTGIKKQNIQWSAVVFAGLAVKSAAASSTRDSVSEKGLGQVGSAIDGAGDDPNTRRRPKSQN